MKQRKKSFGMRISAFVLSFAMVCTLLAGVNVVAFAADDNDLIVSVHSFYNDADKGGDGEHLFTKDADEMSWLSSLPTWNDEGESWKAPVSSSLAVYRVYNPNSGEHHYAAADEASWLVSQGWTQEKIAFYSDDNMGVPVYRLWNGLDGVGSHYYTTDEGEASWLASIGWQAEGVNFYGVKEEEPEELVIEAMQTGASEVTVTSNIELSDADGFELMRGAIEQGISVEVALDGMSAVITTDSPIADADYTVIVTPLDETIEPASDTFIGEAAKLSSIKFLSDQFVLTGIGTTQNTGFTAIAGFNQFGETEILDGLQTMVVSGSDPATLTYDNENGLLYATSVANAPYVVGNPVSATVVYQKGTTVLQASANLTVAAPQVINDIEFGEIASTNLLLAGQRVTHKGLMTNTYYIPVYATDQYGMDVTATQLNNWMGNSLIVNPSGDQQGYATVSGFDTLEDGTVIMRLENGSIPYPGTQVINLLSVGGTQGTTTVNVEDERYIDEIYVDIPDLYSGQAAEFDVSAVDQYGEEFTDEDLYKLGAVANANNLTFNDTNGLTGTNTTISSSDTNGKFTVVKNPSTKSLKITYKPGATATDSYTIFTITTAAPNVTTENVKVNATAVPAAIKGLADGVDTTIGGMVPGVALGTNTNIAFTDTYGAAYDSSKVNFGGLDDTKANVTVLNKDDFYYTVEAKTENHTALAANGAVTGTSAGSDTYVLRLYKKATVAGQADTSNAIDTRNIKITVADSTFVAYAAGFVNGSMLPKATLYSAKATNAGGDSAILAVYGVDASGNRVPLNTSQYDVVLEDETPIDGDTLSLAVSPQTVAGKTVNVLAVTAAGKTQTAAQQVLSGTATADIYVDGEVVTTASIECTNETPSTIAIMGTKTPIVGGNPVGTKTAVYDLTQGIELEGASPYMVYDNGQLTITDITDANNNDGYAYTIAGVDQYGLAQALDQVTYAGQDVASGATKYAIIDDKNLALVSGSVKLTVPLSRANADFTVGADMTLVGSQTNEGTVTVGNAKTLTIATGATFTNEGTVANSGTITNTGTIAKNKTGNTNMASGTWTGNAPSDAEATAATFTLGAMADLSQATNTIALGSLAFTDQYGIAFTTAGATLAMSDVVLEGGDVTLGNTTIKAAGAATSANPSVCTVDHGTTQYTVASGDTMTMTVTDTASGNTFAVTLTYNGSAWVASNVVVTIV